MNPGPARPSVAVIGAGLAGATCARVLAALGCAVQVVDKARGAGGRLATRRLAWRDAQGQTRVARLDHGAPGFAVSSEAFRRFLADTVPAEGLARWTPRLAPGSRPLDDAGALIVPQPDMPSLCRGLLRDTPATWSFAVDRLVKLPKGWQLEAAGVPLPAHFDAVLLALPPAQAAPLLAPHRSDWAQRASLALMQPCWTLLGVARRPARTPAWADWDVARPQQGPLSWVMHHGTRPGRGHAADETHWVAHARAGWSRQQLEQPAEWVLQQMQAALDDALGERTDWLHATVHRWRYARPPVAGSVPRQPCWWDAARGLGACGDFLGSSGVEGAWLSARALVDAVARDLAPPLPTPGAPAAGHRIHHAAA